MPLHRTTSTPAVGSPLILLTNDDGITSPGLRAAVRAALPLGELLVVAPARQWSGAGRSMPHGLEERVSRCLLEVDGQPITAYQVDASPATAVAHALVKLAPRRPALLISGINYGENLGSDVTISGTVGAAFQGAAFGIPALAASLQTPKETYDNPSEGVDFTAAIHFTRLFARWMLQAGLPFDVDVLKIDVPDDATPETPWRLTRVSRHIYFVPIPPQRARLEDPASPPLAGGDREDPLVGESRGGIEYEPLPHPERAEPDSDIYALAVDRVVSVAPLSLDTTSRAERGEMEALLRGPAAL